MSTGKAKENFVVATKEGRLYIRTKDFFKQDKIRETIEKLRNSKVVKNLEKLKMKKLKTYVLTVSQHFPSYHPMKGQRTSFPRSILCLLKLHTVRANYELWKKRIDEVNAGKAVLSVRYWDGKPYKDKQKEFQCYDKDSGIGIQRLDAMCFVNNTAFVDETESNYIPVTLDMLADNDGLTLQQFKDWFRKPNSEPMAIIHFTNFRYKV